jgi:accessory colonization factor AcfC
MSALKLGTIVLCAVFATSLQASAATPEADQQAVALNIYGPGGLLPAMKGAAATFAKKYHMQGNVVWRSSTEVKTECRCTR